MPNILSAHWHRRGHTRRSLGAARHRSTGLAHTGTEQGVQHGDRIRRVNEGREACKEPRQRRVIEGKEAGLFGAHPHGQPPLVQCTSFFITLPGLDLGEALTLDL
jgi:hypothetical protein